MIEKYYYEKVIDEIIEMIKTNIIIYYNNDMDSFLGLRKHCNDTNNSNKDLEYYQLLYFVEETLADLINCNYLYDFRALD